MATWCVTIVCAGRNTSLTVWPHAACRCVYAWLLLVLAADNVGAKRGCSRAVKMCIPTNWVRHRQRLFAYVTMQERESAICISRSVRACACTYGAHTTQGATAMVHAHLVREEAVKETNTVACAAAAFEPGRGVVASSPLSWTVCRCVRPRSRCKKAVHES